MPEEAVIWKNLASPHATGQEAVEHDNELPEPWMRERHTCKQEHAPVTYEPPAQQAKHAKKKDVSPHAHVPQWKRSFAVHRVQRQPCKPRRELFS